MNCPYCKSKNIRRCKEKTALGYEQYRCGDCSKQYNERTGTSFNYIQYRTEVVMLAMHYYFRFRNSLDNVVELMAMRNIYLSHQTVHNWTQIFGVELGLKLRKMRKGKTGKKWHTDATYIRFVALYCKF